MNKQLAIKYKTEFNHWLQDKPVLYSAGKRSDWYWQPVSPKFSWDLPYFYHFIIDDEYSIFRKALAEGKTIQFLQGSRNDTQWIEADASYFNGAGTNYLRIKPDEPKFKVGDWVRDTRKGMKTSIVQLEENCLVLTDYEEHGTQYILWEPQPGEWCWFWNTGQTSTAVLDRFARKLKAESSYQGSYKTKMNVYYQHCQPFIGTLPTHLQE